MAVSVTALDLAYERDEVMWCSPRQQAEVRNQATDVPPLTEPPEAAAAIKPDAEDLLEKSPTCDLLVWPARLIRASALVVILFELACIMGEAAANHTDPVFILPFHTACLVLGTLLLASSFQPRLRQRWQLLNFIIISAVVVLTTILGIARETADQFFVDLLVLSLGVNSPLPWSFGWQAGANALMLISLAAFAAFAPAHDPLLYTHWVGLVAGAGVVQLCSNYGNRYRQEVKEEFLRQSGHVIEDIRGRSALEIGPSIFRDARFRSALHSRGEIRNMDF